jgi:hypothetical protein
MPFFYQKTAQNKSANFPLRPPYNIGQIRKYSNDPIALCKESADAWNQLGLDLSKIRCVCQLDDADMNRGIRF